MHFFSLRCSSAAEMYGSSAPSAAVADVLEAELGVPKGRYYINFFDSERSNMGYNGGTF